MGCYTGHSPDDLTDIGGDEVADELFHVVVDSSTLLNSSHNGREVVVSQDHLRGRLGNGSARAHGDANLRLLQGRGIVDSVTGHGSNLVSTLEVNESMNEYFSELLKE